jgi:hypothetical protein
MMGDAHSFVCAGGSAYGLLFASDGSAAVVLAEEDDAAKETKILMMLPWVTVYYMHRREEDFMQLVLTRALHAASMRMGFPFDDHIKS